MAKALIDYPEFYRVHAALHVLWTKAAEHKDDYVKKEWQELDNAIVELGSKAFPCRMGEE